MELYASVLSYAIPGFVLLIIVEYFASLYLGKSVNRPMDTISSLSSGMTNTLKELIGLAIILVSYAWMVQHIALFNVGPSISVYLISFVLIDFASYWSHRFNHEINVMWNRHIVHHSSEEFNLSCALRQSISGIIGVYFFLYIPLALVGVPAIVVAIVAPLHLFAQFWYHTRLIDKMSWLEYVIVTPSHHRVHHAINPEYIDKNYAAIFIIWDKLFGTFKEEDPEIPPVYGVKKPVRTWNPFIINYQHLFLLLSDTWRTKNWIDKIKLWVMPTGWRPRDVQENYPVKIIEDVYSYKKYDPVTPNGLVTWSWIQLIIHNLLMYYLLISIPSISPLGIGLFVVFLAVSIFAYTSLMDLHIISIPVELVKFVLGIIIYIQLDWFNIDQSIPFSFFIAGSLHVYFQPFSLSFLSGPAGKTLQNLPNPPWFNFLFEVYPELNSIAQIPRCSDFPESKTMEDYDLLY